jgi:predicted DNA-binding antitoxin AbrB/MazE fold protein
MTAETIEAVYKDGGFRPISPVGVKLIEGQKVRIMVEPVEAPDDILALAAQVYDGLSEDQINTIEKHIQRRKDFFEERTS